MAMVVQTHTEPIPGYRLLERIGGGGYGEVWKCEAPGGLLKAIKFVHGTLHGDGDGGAVLQELRSLNRVKTVRHPFILSLERYDIIDGQLVIVMELADRNLWDRFQECRAQGLPGIPRAELLRYMEEAAEALDLMNIEHQLQHLDIKPQNLFLVHNHIKVADFGLVKDLEGISQLNTSVTPVYAAPETLGGTVSRSSDQYNLAIVYQELLTGLRPFSGGTARQLLLQHMSGSPDLTPLPPCDRAAIGRALSKTPDDRFPTCTDLVRALQPAGQGGGAVELTQPANITETPAVIRVSPTARLEKPALGPQTPTQSVRGRTGVIERRPEGPPVEEITGTGVLFPALVIGLGGLGREVLEHLRADLEDRCGPAGAIPHIRLLAIDTDAESASATTPHSTRLAEKEVLIAPLNKPAHYLKPVRNRAALDTWLNLSMLCRVPRQQTTPHGLRILGRLALVDNYRTILARLRSELQACTNSKALTTADRQTRLGVRSNRPRVYVIAGLGGGTGSGTFIDVAYVTRYLLRGLGYQDPDVVGVLLLPNAARQSPALGNAFAALTELNHFSLPQVTYQAFFDEQEEPISDPAAPFSRCVMVPLPEEGKDPTPTRDLAGLVGDALARELVTPLGRRLDDERAKGEPDAASATGAKCQAFGAYRFSVPRRAVTEQVSRALSLRLVKSWLSADRLEMRHAVWAHLSEKRPRLELQPEALTAALNSACVRALGESPEAACSAVIAQALARGAGSPAAILSTLTRVNQLVGQPGDDSGQTTLAQALTEAARLLTREGDQKLSDLIASLIDRPGFRMAGADEAVLQLTGMLSEAARTQRTRLQALEARAVELQAHVHSLAVRLQKGSWWPGHKARMTAELRQTLAELPRVAYEAQLVRRLIDVYQALRDTLPVRQEEIRFCRQRLGEFQQKLGAGRATEQKALELGFGEHFLPVAANTIDAAVDQLLHGIKPEDLRALDEKIQGVVRRQFQSLAQLCLSPATGFQELRTAIEQQTESYVDGLIGKASAAAVYLKERHADAEVRADLARAFDEAVPALAGSPFSGPELCILAVPADVAGSRLGQLAAAMANGVQVVAVPGVSDVYFYREQPHLPLADLPQLGLQAEQIYRQMTSGNFTPHTRMDVIHWEQPT
jgi:hypothetical protein